MKFLLSAFLSIVLLAATTFALDGTRLAFKKGKSSASVAGTVAQGGPDFYLVTGKAGQKIKISVKGKVSFGLTAPDEDRLTEDDANQTYTTELPSDGDYQIWVYSTGGAQKYTLSVSIK